MAISRKWFLDVGFAKPILYIFEEPTAGVDIRTKLELYRVIRRLADEGAAVLVLTSDLIELIGMCDRILVVAHGSIVDSVTAAEATEERIIGSAVRKKRENANPEQSPGKETGQRTVRVGIGDVLLRRYAGAGFVGVLILLLGAYTTSRSPYFLTERNLGIMIQIAPLALVALGQMMVILISGIDLSVGPSMSMITALASYVIVGEANGNLAVGVVLCLLAGILVGTLNGLLILYLRIPDLIATLSTFSVVTGFALIVRPSPGGKVSEVFADMITMRIGWFPIIGLAVILLTIAGEILQLRGRMGTRLYAIGSQPGSSVCGRNSRSPSAFSRLSILWTDGCVGGAGHCRQDRERRSPSGKSVYFGFGDRGGGWRYQHFWRSRHRGRHFTGGHLAYSHAELPQPTSRDRLLPIHLDRSTDAFSGGSLFGP